jgi:hypothetical protein
MTIGRGECMLRSYHSRKEIEKGIEKMVRSLYRLGAFGVYEEYDAYNALVKYWIRDYEYTFHNQF